MKRKYLLCLLFALLLVASLLAGCSTRSPQRDEPSESSPEESLVAPDFSEEEELAEESSEEERVEVLGLQDEEQVAEATQIVETLLARAAVCDSIYRGALPTDENMPPTAFGEGEDYLLVSHGEFVSTDDIRAFWSNTFTAEEISSARYGEMNDRKTYVSANQELYTLAKPLDQPLTLGEWNASTLRIIRFDSEWLEAVMETSLVGEDAGKHHLLAKNTGGTWRLTDSYFID